MRVSGYWIIVTVATVVAAFVAWRYGAAWHISPEMRVFVVALAGMLLLILRAPLASLGHWLAQQSPHRSGTRYTRDAAARVTTGNAPVASSIPVWPGQFLHTLRSQYGLRWRYRLPWLLLTGEASVVRRLLPGLAGQGWLVTDDAVLLWRQTDANGCPDEAWLREIRRMRRSRPVDAVILVLDGEAPLPAARGVNAWGLGLARMAGVLRWSAPVFVLDAGGADVVHDGSTPVVGCHFVPRANAPAIEDALLALRGRLATQGVRRLELDRKDNFAAALSKRLDERPALLAPWIASLAGRQRRALRVAGAFFVPLPESAGASSAAEPAVESTASPVASSTASPASVSASASATASNPDSMGLPLWRYLAELALYAPGRRTRFHPVTVFSASAFALLGLWCAGMGVSGLVNAHEVLASSQSLNALDQARSPAGRLRALLGLQQRIAFYEARQAHPLSPLSRFGLNRDRASLAALWTPYARASRALLVMPVQQAIEGQLADLGQMSTGQVDDKLNALALDGQQTLKTYLMMAEPERAEPAFMTPQLVREWNTSAALSAGEKFDLSQRLLAFYAQHLGAHPGWRIQAREDLVAMARRTLLAVIGVKNSGDTLYAGVLATVGHKYPDQTLATLSAGTDTRGVFSTGASVPGVFTRQAWEGTIGDAIDDAAKHNGIVGDWVLGQTGAAPGQKTSAPTADALRETLRARYFADYAEHWQAFMNSVRCAPTATMPEAIAQLKVLADARQSPLIALMKALDYQGGAGAPQASLSDTLVSKAQGLLGGGRERARNAPAAPQVDPAGPLGASFGPILRLVGAQDGAAGSSAQASASDLSLQRFTEHVSTLRLKLQQIADSADSDAQAQQVAQSLFQGRGSEMADTLAYARLVSASLGEQWSGMGEALFVRPVAQATQTVLAPAEASLNSAWQQAIVASWNRAFAGRYPFASTSSDASLPELARFLRPQGGLIGTFLSTQLAGMVQLQGDRWVPVTGGAGMGSAATGSEMIDPSFLAAINTLQSIAGHLLAQGEPRYLFEFRPVASPGITDTVLNVDGQRLHYFNQQEAWQSFGWPQDDLQRSGTRLEWQTERAGTNKSLEFSGRWAFIRMLERARVEPVNSATYQLTWQASATGGQAFGQTSTARASGAKSAAAAAAIASADPDSLDTQNEPAAASSPSPSATAALRYQIRTDVGKGPLELLALRGFVLPARIFVVPQTRRPGQPPLAGPPPLPPAAITAANRVGVPLPGQ